MRHLPATLVLAAGVSLVTAVAFAGRTPDGQTPAEETVCDGLSGAAFGLCNAYCEATDCGDGVNNANESACASLRKNWKKHTGLDELPCDCVEPFVFVPGEGCECPPEQRDECAALGGSFDPVTCKCVLPCAASGAPECGGICPDDPSVPELACLPDRAGCSCQCVGPDLVVRVRETTGSGFCPGTADCCHEFDIEIENVGGVDVVDPFDVDVARCGFGVFVTLHRPGGLAAGAIEHGFAAFAENGDICFEPDCEITVTVDPDTVIEECDESNNTDSLVLVLD